MAKANIRCTRQVRALLVELDAAFAQFGKETAILADRTTDEQIGRRVGYDRESTRNLIVGLAWRINRASKGETDA